MNVVPSSPATAPVIRFFTLAALCCLALTFSACAGKDGEKKPGPAVPGQHQLAYDISVTVPPAWKVLNSVGQQTPKDGLDTRRKGGERILMLETVGPASARGLESMIGVFLVNQEGTFMPRDYAERLQPDEFVAMSKDLLDREKAEAKKKKTTSGLLDLQLARETINGNMAVSQKMLVAGPDGKPVRLMNWDIYLPDGAGIAVKTVCDQETPGAENEVVNIVRSVRAPQ